jgi:hypothetical protein
MDLALAVKDWEVAGVAQVGGAAVVGAGAWWFEFRSPSKKLRELFMFVGAGLGGGGSIGGATAGIDFESQGLQYTAIVCERAFSVSDLDMSAGRLTVLGAGLAIGYGYIGITAFNRSGFLFSSQDLHGLTVGVGVSGMTTVGYWRSATIAGREASKVSRDYLTRTAKGR